MSFMSSSRQIIKNYHSVTDLACCIFVDVKREKANISNDQELRNQNESLTSKAEVGKKNLIDSEIMFALFKLFTILKKKETHH